MRPEDLLRRALKPLVFVACLVPLGLMAWQGLNDALGANPIEELTHRTGDWTLRLLLITLAVTPLRQTLGWTALMRLRRMLGLFGFFYACLHLTVYLWLDQFFDWGEIAADIAERPYITVGFAAFVALIPLAATSTRGMVRRLGRHWVRLHKAIYAIAILGVLHFWWLVKADVREPAIYAAVLTLLLGYRLLRARRVPAARLAAWPQASTRNP